MSDDDKLQNSKKETDEEKLYKEILTKEMLKKIENRISSADTNFLKTIKLLLKEDDKKPL